MRKPARPRANKPGETDRARGGREASRDAEIKGNAQVRAEDRLRLAVSTANVGFFDWDLHTDKAYFSPEWKRQIGYREDEISDHISEWSSRVHPDDLKPLLESTERFLKEAWPNHQAEFRFLHKDGNYRWILAQAALLLDARGKPVRMLGAHMDITERKRAEQAMQQGEERFRCLVEFSPLGIFRTDASGAVSYINPRVSAITGFPAKAMLGEQWKDIVHEDDRERVVDNWARAVKDRTPIEQDMRVRKPDGEIIWLVGEARPELDEQGRLRGYIGTVRDTSDINRAQVSLAREQAALRETTERLNHLLTTSPTILYSTRIRDGEVHPAWISDSVTRLLGYTPKEALDAGWWPRHLHPEDRDRILATVPELIARGFLINEYRFLRKDGSVIWIRDEARMLSPAGATEVEIVGAWIDVTPRRRAEERLRLDAAAIESTRDGVLITDRDGRIVSANRSFQQTMGYPEAEILGQTPSLLRSGRHGRDFYQSMWTDISSTGHWQGEIWNRRRNGEIFPVWVTINAVCNERGEPTHYVAVYTDISKLKQSEEELEHLAHFDPLTDLPNRLLLQSRLEHAVDQARRREHHVAVLFIDLDDFKKVNDSLGHLIGDELLIAVARRLSGRVRGEDTLARLGGDEFVVLLEELHRADEAATVARDLHASLSAPFNLSSGHELYVQASIGISIFPDDSSSPAELLRDADTAMYRSKEGGGGRFRFFTSDMSVQAFATLELESALRQALERDEFLLYYQPTMDLRTERIYGAEALLRWRRSDGRILSPGEFIPIAEKTGLIIPIGNWVIDTACSQLNAWQRHDLSALQVAVNVSARQFRSGELESEIAAAINRHRIPPGLLSLELTESMLMEQPEEATEILRRLKELGVLLSLDDFGTGFSSLAYLTRFPVDTLKIDASFVSDVESDSAAMTVVNAVIELAHRMGMRAIAEGVETPSQYNYLKARGCDAMQGYLISKPLPVDQFCDLLHSRQAPAHQNRRN